MTVNAVQGGTLVQQLADSPARKGRRYLGQLATAATSLYANTLFAKVCFGSVLSHLGPVLVFTIVPLFQRLVVYNTIA